MLKKLFSSSLTYMLGSLVAGGLSFATLPIYTRFLNPQDFGALALIGATIGVLSNVVGLQPVLFLRAHYVKLEREEFQQFATASLLLTVAMGVPAAGVLEFLRVCWRPFHFEHWVIAGVVALVVLGNVVQIGFMVLQMGKNPTKYVLVQLAKAVLIAGVGISLVVCFGVDWRGKFAGQLIAAGIFGVGFAYYLVRNRFLSFNTTVDHIRRFWTYSWPLAFHALSFWAVSFQDRYFLAEMEGMRATGLYGVGYTLSNVLMVAFMGAASAFHPYFYEQISEGKESKRRIVQITYLLTVFFVLSSVIFLLLLKPLMPLITGGKFENSYPFVPWLAVAHVFHAVFHLATQYYYVEDKTQALGVLTVVAALANALLNWILIGQLGAVGAAVATALSFALVAILSFVQACRLVPMPWLSPFGGPQEWYE